MNHCLMFHRKTSPSGQLSLLRFAVETNPLADIILNRLQNPHPSLFFVPKEWNLLKQHKQIVSYNGVFEIPQNTRYIQNDWITFSNASYRAEINPQLISFIRTKHHAQVFLITVDPLLTHGHEKVKISSQNNLAGVRRLYSDHFEPGSIPNDWPHVVMINAKNFEKNFNCRLPVNFSDFLNICSEKNIAILSFKAGGNLDHLETEDGLLNSLPPAFDLCKGVFKKRIDSATQNGARICGPVMIGKNVKIDSHAIILGPAVISDNAHIGSFATVCSSIIGPHVEIEPETCLNHRIVRIPPQIQNQSNAQTLKIPRTDRDRNTSQMSSFRKWPLFSYVRFTKPVLDLLVAVPALIILFPLFPVIAILIKLTSKGPVFFPHKRQGLHGKDFHCMKFRTMVVNADGMQEILRAKNEVDGPQFKMDKDPRITPIGKFLRETFIDEIPQLLSVVSGKMSLIGPRPSPAAENSMCPFWRDARLSVKPGITGLWQVSRTRALGQDFQEWIYYDTRYVENISVTLDALIFLKTVAKIAKSLFSQIYKMLRRQQDA